MIQLVIPFLLSTASISCSVINDAEPLTNGSISEILTMSSDGSMASPLPKAEFGQSLTPKEIHPIEQCTVEFQVEFEGPDSTAIDVPVHLVQDPLGVSKLTETVLEGQNVIWTHGKNEMFHVYREPYLDSKAIVIVKRVDGNPTNHLFDYGKSRMSLEPDVKELRMCRKIVRAGLGTAKRALGTFRLWGANHLIFNVTLGGVKVSSTPNPSIRMPTTRPTVAPTTRPTVDLPNEREKIAYMVITVSSSVLFAMIFFVCFDGWRKNRKTENKAK